MQGKGGCIVVKLIHLVNFDILQINSPRKRLKGPYSVVYKDRKARFAIVTMDWDNKPTLGIRWFWDGCGYPNTHGYPTWLVAPDFIQQYILPNFNVPPNLETRIKKFLEGEIKGEDLQKSK